MDLHRRGFCANPLLLEQALSATQFGEQILPPPSLSRIGKRGASLFRQVEIVRDLLRLAGAAADQFVIPSGQLGSVVQRREFLIDPGVMIELWVPAKRFERQIVQLVPRTGDADLSDDLQTLGLVRDGSATRLVGGESVSIRKPCGRSSAFKAAAGKQDFTPEREAVAQSIN